MRSKTKKSQLRKKARMDSKLPYAQLADTVDPPTQGAEDSLAWASDSAAGKTTSGNGGTPYEDDASLIPNKRKSSFDAMSALSIDSSAQGTGHLNYTTVALSSNSQLDSSNHNIQPPSRLREGTIFSSVMNLTNTILGAGLLGLPYAVSRSGSILSVISLFIFGTMSSIGLHLLMCAARTQTHSSFYVLSQATIPKARTLVDMAVALKCFGVGSSYLIVVGDLIPDVISEIGLNSSAWKSRRLWISVFSVVFIIPFVQWRSLDRLKFTSGFALICFAYVLIVIVVYALLDTDSLDACSDEESHSECVGNKPMFAKSVMHYVKILPIYIFAFTCHQNAFPIVNELQDNRVQRLNYIIMISIMVCFLVYFTVGISGFFTFGDKVNPDILTNYPKEILVGILRVALSIALAWSYPLQCDPCRRCLSYLIWKQDLKDLSDKQFYMLTYSIVFGSFCIAMVVKDLGIVLALVGATGSTCITYLLPGLFYYHLHKHDKSDWKNYLSLFMVGLGCLIIPIAVTLQFI